VLSYTRPVLARIAERPEPAPETMTPLDEYSHDDGLALGEYVTRRGITVVDRLEAAHDGEAVASCTVPAAPGSNRLGSIRMQAARARAAVPPRLV